MTRITLEDLLAELDTRPQALTALLRQHAPRTVTLLAEPAWADGYQEGRAADIDDVEVNPHTRDRDQQLGESLTVVGIGRLHGAPAPVDALVLLGHDIPQEAIEAYLRRTLRNPAPANLRIGAPLIEQTRLVMLDAAPGPVDVVLDDFVLRRSGDGTPHTVVLLMPRG